MKLQRPALVERSVACAGKGQYIAVVHHGSAGGDLYQRVFEYSHKDPRAKGEDATLRDITQEIPARYRRFIIAISVIKRCLHPKNDKVPKWERTPYFERVYAWVVEHDGSIQQAFGELQGEQLKRLLQNHTVLLPYTSRELRLLPVKDVLITNYWQNMHASVGLRGVERIVGWRDLLVS
jgi:hypothetical protein